MVYDASLPDYVSPKVNRRINEIIDEGYMNPRHPGCDFTVEVAAGAHLMDALTRLIERHKTGDASSIYRPNTTS